MAIHWGGRGVGHASRWPQSVGPLGPAIRLTSASIAEGATTGREVGTASVVNPPEGMGTLTWSETGGTGAALFAINSSTGVITNTAALDHETATSYTYEINADDGLGNSYTRLVTISISNVYEAANLSALGFDDSELVQSASSTVNITSATSGSTLTASGLPAGMSINSGARTITGTPTTVGTGSATITETLADSANSPRDTVWSWEVVVAPAVAISDEFPVLKSAYETGDRALISCIGDSVTAGQCAGVDIGGGILIGDADENSVAAKLSEYLQGNSISAVTGTFGAADKGFNAILGVSPTNYGKFYSPDATFDASFAYYGAPTPFGYSQAYSSTGGDKVSWTPGFAFDRIEALYLTFTGAGAFDVKVGGVTLATCDGNVSSSLAKTEPIECTYGNNTIDMVVASGQAWPGALRVWDSTAGGVVQIENLGISGHKCSDWLSTSSGFSPGNTFGVLGAHLYIVNLGLNEQGQGVSDGDYQANLTALINALLATDADVLVCVPTPATLTGYDMSSGKRAAVAAACTAAGIAPPVDLYASAGIDTGTDLADGLHPNAGGNAKIAAAIGQRLLAA